MVLKTQSQPLPAVGKPVTSPSRIGDTLISYAPAREVLTKATGFMGEYDFTLNPYSGCSFGCTYCYAAFFSRTAEARDDWGRWVKVKENAVELLSRRKPGSLDGKLIYMSSVTDPYQPVERELRLTRGLLEVLAGEQALGGTRRKDVGQERLNLFDESPDEPPKPKLVVQTRSPDVVRDCDLFHRIEENGGRAQVNMTVTTDDEEVRRTFEPSCPSNAVRLRAIGEVQAAGVQTCVTMTPLLWVSNPHVFAESLLATGVKSFIVQPFHHQRGKFVASTREKAVELMAQKLNCDRASVRERYDTHYAEAYAVLRTTLTEGGATLGVGKEGFAPPF